MSSDRLTEQAGYDGGNFKDLLLKRGGGKANLS